MTTVTADQLIVADRPWVDVTAHGATAGAPDSTTGLRNAFLKAASTASECILPAGEYRWDPLNTNAFGSMQMRGPGATLRAKTPAPSGGVLHMVVSNASRLIEDLTLRGPEEIGVGAGLDGVLHLGGVGKLHLRRCRVLGFRPNGIKIDGGTVDLTIEHSEIDCQQGVTFKGNGHLVIRDSVVRGYGEDGTNKKHGLYIYRTGSVLLDGVRFEQAAGTGTGYAIQIYGGDAGVPDLVEIRSCTFGSSVYRGIVTSNRVRTLIEACTFRTTNFAVNVYGDTTIAGCLFAGAMNRISPTNAAHVRIEGCDFTTHGLAVENNIAGATWDVSDCRFVGTKANSIATVAGSVTRIRRCTFSDGYVEAEN